MRSVEINEQSGNAEACRNGPPVADHHRIHRWRKAIELIKRIAVMRGLILIRTHRRLMLSRPRSNISSRRSKKTDRGRGRRGFWMSAFLIANGAVMFASLVVVLLLGYPAAFSLGAVGLIYAFVGIQLGEFRPTSAGAERVYGVMNNDTLLAIPFFTFMGLVLERSGMAETCSTPSGSCSAPSGWPRLRRGVRRCPARRHTGGCGFRISMGRSAADHAALWIRPVHGFRRRAPHAGADHSPSLVLIVMADQLGKSVGDMYEGAFVRVVLAASMPCAFFVDISKAARVCCPKRSAFARRAARIVVAVGAFHCQLFLRLVHDAELRDAWRHFVVLACSSASCSLSWPPS
jgi:hypothetical protein